MEFFIAMSNSVYKSVCISMQNVYAIMGFARKKKSQQLCKKILSPESVKKRQHAGYPFMDLHLWLLFHSFLFLHIKNFIVEK